MKKLEVISFNGTDGKPNGVFIKQSTKNPEWATVLVMTSAITMSNGVINNNKRIASIRAKKVELDALGLTLGCDFNEKLTKLGAKAMQIAVKETVAPQYEGHQPKINPTTKAVITAVAGGSIYYNTVLVEDDGANHDVIIPSVKAAGTTTNVATPALEKSPA